MKITKTEAAALGLSLSKDGSINWEPAIRQARKEIGQQTLTLDPEPRPRMRVGGNRVEVLDRSACLTDMAAEGVV